ncbi:hypothetical protein IKP94_01105 [Candidatus Saccharibacteria bacterium]|nr:hypothetical protein [Candidatus Saccharibacteria bacterium]MBR6964912.1 hypothetical protein [Candidatus Saccharibacteria bacterium]
MQDDSFITNPEIINPKVNSEPNVAAANNWNAAMTDAPEYAGDSSENINTAPAPIAEAPQLPGEQDDDGIENASAIINYGLDAAARTLGVEAVAQMIKNFDCAGSEDPIRDLYNALGIDTKEERQELHDVRRANMGTETEFREEFNVPAPSKYKREAAIKAIQDMKELISEVEGADPAYAAMRNETSGQGYFAHAVEGYEKQGFVELFRALKKQREEYNKAQAAQPEGNQIIEKTTDENATIEKTTDTQN